MSPRFDGRREVARFLVQRKDLGLGEIFLDRLSRKQFLKCADQREDSSESVSGEATAVSSPELVPVARDLDEPSPEVDVSQLDYEILKQVAESCERCRLSKGRTQVVFSDGNPQARLIIVGEAPGANEDRTGLPFVGQAGKLLDLLLASIDLSRRDTAYICNVLKCRPPANRDPMVDEIDLCAPYLRRQIALVAPEVILAVGTFAAKLLTGKNRPLGKLRGSVFSYEGVPLVVTYHPAALLRNPSWTRSTWNDLQLLREVLDRN